MVKIEVFEEEECGRKTDYKIFISTEIGVLTFELLKTSFK